MAAENKDRLVATYYYEDPKIPAVNVYGYYPADSEKRDEYEWFDIFDGEGNCLNEGEAFHPDVKRGGLPSWEDVAIHLNLFKE